MPQDKDRYLNSQDHLGYLERLDRLEVDGKFFRAGGRRVFLKAVTYGPFPDPQPDHAEELRRIARAGFNAVRVYGDPDLAMLDAAVDAGLWVMIGPSWQWGCDFIQNRSLLSAAMLTLSSGLREWGSHPAVAVVFVANEIPTDMVRWMGVLKVRRAIEALIDLGRELFPELLFAYANFPTTEYLEPDNADFTAMNVYLENRVDFSSYLPRLHNVAGDRAVLLSEFGLDSRRGSEIGQRDALVWQLDECLQAGMAGTTMYAWSDRWLNGGRVMDEWAFGLTDSSGREKPALSALSRLLPDINSPEDGIKLDHWPMFSVVVCTYNGGRRMRACLSALCDLDYPDYEIIVVDDGSTDDTAAVVGEFERVRLVTLDHVGLSAARNRGAEEAKGKYIAYTDDDCEPDAAWLLWLADAFFKENWDACGGPNLPPLPRITAESSHAESVDEAVVASAPGAPSHVLLGDVEAEHLPGCNLVLRKQALMAIGGFDAKYRVAGDDVDLCWRLRAAGYRMGFSGAAFVWHRRRTTLWRYFKQQRGYGKAEALLMRDHPDKFRRGSGARWAGRVYAGGAMCADEGSVIYHGLMGTAPYQQLSLVMQPQRPLPHGFQGVSARLKLTLAQHVQPWVRAVSRWWYSLRWRGKVQRGSRLKGLSLVNFMEDRDDVEFHWWGGVDVSRERVLRALRDAGWVVLGEGECAEWDLIRDGMRLLVACEIHDDSRRVLIRIETNPSSATHLPDDVQQVMLGCGLRKN